MNPAEVLKSNSFSHLGLHLLLSQKTNKDHLTPHTLPDFLDLASVENTANRSIGTEEKATMTPFLLLLAWLCMMIATMFWAWSCLFLANLIFGLDSVDFSL